MNDDLERIRKECPGLRDSVRIAGMLGFGHVCDEGACSGPQNVAAFVRHSVMSHQEQAYIFLS
jgi:hypothetical protein